MVEGEEKAPAGRKKTIPVIPVLVDYSEEDGSPEYYTLEGKCIGAPGVYYQYGFPAEYVPVIVGRLRL